MKNKKKPVKLRKKNILEKIRVLDNLLDRNGNKAFNIIKELNAYVKTLPQDDKGNAVIDKDIANMYKHLTRIKIGINTIKAKKSEDILGPEIFGDMSVDTDSVEDEIEKIDNKTSPPLEKKNEDVVLLD